MRRRGGQASRSRSGCDKKLRRATGAAVKATERLVGIGRIKRCLVRLTGGDRSGVQGNIAIGFDHPATGQTKLAGGSDRHIAAKIDIASVGNGAGVRQIKVSEVEVGKSAGGKAFDREITHAGRSLSGLEVGGASGLGHHHVEVRAGPVGPGCIKAAGRNSQ